MARYRGGWTFKRGNEDGPPETFTTVPHTSEVPGFGKTNNEITGSDWDDDFNEFVLPGRATGREITLTFNYDHNDTDQQFMIQKVEDAENGNIQIIQSQATPKTYQMNVAYLGWDIAPGSDDTNKLVITVKISGPITSP